MLPGGGLQTRRRMQSCPTLRQIVRWPRRYLERLGKKSWRRHVADVVTRLKDALEPDYVVLGGGNAQKVKSLGEGVRRGDNQNAFIGGVRLWRMKG